jgi:homoserine dehydrogenase
LPAASAVVGDTIEVARHYSAGCLGYVGCTCAEELPVRDMGSLVTRYYIRLQVVDEPGVLASTSRVFADHGVSLASVMQPEVADGSEAELVYVTHTASEAAVRESLTEIGALPVVRAVGAVIRVEDL